MAGTYRDWLHLGLFGHNFCCLFSIYGPRVKFPIYLFFFQTLFAKKVCYIMYNVCYSDQYLFIFLLFKQLWMIKMRANGNVNINKKGKKYHNSNSRHFYAEHGPVQGNLSCSALADSTNFSQKQMITKICIKTKLRIFCKCNFDGPKTK